jgi:hypothetical protein
VQKTITSNRPHGDVRQPENLKVYRTLKKCTPVWRECKVGKSFARVVKLCGKPWQWWTTIIGQRDLGYTDQPIVSQSRPASEPFPSGMSKRPWRRNLVIFRQGECRASVGMSNSDRRDRVCRKLSLFIPSHSTRANSPGSTTFSSCSGASASVPFAGSTHMSLYSDTISSTLCHGMS